MIFDWDMKVKIARKKKFHSDIGRLRYFSKNQKIVYQFYGEKKFPLYLYFWYTLFNFDF